MGRLRRPPERAARLMRRGAGTSRSRRKSHWGTVPYRYPAAPRGPNTRAAWRSVRAVLKAGSTDLLAPEVAQGDRSFAERADAAQLAEEFDERAVGLGGDDRRARREGSGEAAHRVPGVGAVRVRVRFAQVLVEP